MQEDSDVQRIPHKDFQVVVFIRGLHGTTPLMRDELRSNRYWALPSDRSSTEETPPDTALRILREQVGISLSKDDLQLTSAEPQEDLNRHVYLVHTNLTIEDGYGENSGWLMQRQMFHIADLEYMCDFLPTHLDILAAHQLISAPRCRKKHEC
ncbi:MAG TPA: hypothetical protein VF803_01495 [Candidatus Paceibacterota bacterium]